MQLNRGQLGLESIGRDLNVEPVWMQGITGLNVTVAVVDDGKLQYLHVVSYMSSILTHSISPKLASTFYYLPLH